MIFGGGTMAVARLCCGMLAAAAFCSAACGDALPDGWAPKFYHGLEAAGRVSSDQTGFRGREPSIYITWESGMPKFGVAKRVETELRGVVDWAVSAYVKCGENGLAWSSWKNASTRLCPFCIRPSRRENEIRQVRHTVQ